MPFLLFLVPVLFIGAMVGLMVYENQRLGAALLFPFTWMMRAANGL